MRLRRKPQPLEMAERRRRRPGQACPWRCGSRRAASRTPDTCRVLVRRDARLSHLAYPAASHICPRPVLSAPVRQSDPAHALRRCARRSRGSRSRCIRSRRWRRSWADVRSFAVSVWTRWARPAAGRVCPGTPGLATSARGPFHICPGRTPRVGSIGRLRLAATSTACTGSSDTGLSGEGVPRFGLLASTRDCPSAFPPDLHDASATSSSLHTYAENTAARLKFRAAPPSSALSAGSGGCATRRRGDQ